MPTRILFISHDASRTGAPIVLLELIKWLRENHPEIVIDVLLLKGGVLIDDFKESTTNLYIYSTKEKPLKFSDLVYQKAMRKFGVKPKKDSQILLKNLSNENYNLIYANTINTVVVGSLIKEKSFSSKLLLHVHELNTTIKMILPNFGDFIDKVDKFVGVSELVKDNLIKTCKIKSNLIEVIYPFSKTINIQNNKTTKKFIVGGSGTVHWRKGYDLFIQVAHYIDKKYPTVKIEFDWIGDDFDLKEVVKLDLEKSGLNNIVSFKGEQSQPEKYFKEFDVFLMTSREDPFPLVCIEVAMLSKPIICFENAVGTVEVLNNGGGYIVPYLDIEAMAEKVIFYFKNQNEIVKDGEIAKTLFSEFTSEKICPKIYKTIINTIN